MNWENVGMKNAGVIYQLKHKSTNSSTNTSFNIFSLFSFFKGTLIQISKSANVFAFMWKEYVEDFTLKHLILFEIMARKVCEKFVYKHSETIEYVKNEPTRYFIY